MEGVKQCLVAINLKEVLTFKKPGELLPLEGAWVSVWRGRAAVGIAALATAKEKIPCQEMHHYIRAHVQSPHNADLPGNQTKC